MNTNGTEKQLEEMMSLKLFKIVEEMDQSS